jgi:hypothetical protein
LGLIDAWNEAAIQERAGRLADQALAVWAAPKLDAATLAAYQPESAPVNGGYSTSKIIRTCSAPAYARCSRPSARRCSRSIPA